MYRESDSYVPDFVSIDMSMMGSDFFTLGSILMQAKSSTAVFPLKKPRVMSTGEFSVRKVNYAAESSSDEEDSDVEIVKAVIPNQSRSIQASSIVQPKPIYCYDDQRVGGCQEANCQYCKQSKHTCIACNKKGHGASSCKDTNAQAQYFLQRIKPSAKLSHGDHPLYGGNARILLGKGFSKKSPGEQAAILQEAVKHCQDQAKAIGSGAAAPERAVVYTNRQ
jgi:hypothetical protein